MNPDEAYELLKTLVAPWGHKLKCERDEFGDAIVFTRKDLTHLDADEMSDRLAAWARREAAPLVPHADAFVSFRHARPSTDDEATRDLQEKWLDLEPTLRLEMHRPPIREADVRNLAAMIPKFLAAMEGEGRPSAWRNVDEGNAE